MPEGDTIHRLARRIDPALRSRQALSIDLGAGGTDSFRRDADCWDPYIPVIRFIAR